ncbi:poly-beta-hydroxybutyrate-responsive repressor [Alkalihalobacterium elongatum]|uniref:poly-beta-hydroxybutyrate-responsive repressor n=1 Tax=Alkalihalobacterium elongatum TaxID=2675466 RepID=UPI001C1F7485|nr:poly-beta-hydroxybutyrate-responsive repressor [Alkalihalobacterium elongatum]
MPPRNKSKDKAKPENIANPPKNFMIPVLLLLLKDWNAHGYELMQKLMQFGFQSVDQGNFYRVLRQLEKDELVTSEWDTSSSGPAKRIYSITSAGEQYLDIWANSLEQYQKILDQFFNLYSNFFTPPRYTSKKEEKTEE